MNPRNFPGQDARRRLGRVLKWGAALILIGAAAYSLRQPESGAAPELESMVRDLRSEPPIYCAFVNARAVRSMVAGKPSLLPSWLVAHARSRSEAVRRRRSEARIYLSRAGTDLAPVFPELIDALDDGDFEVRWAALDVLFRARIYESPWFEEMKQSLRGRARPVEVLAYVLQWDLAPYFNLGMQGAEARRFVLLCLPSCDATPALVPVLVKYVQDKDQGPAMRALAVLALAHHGWGHPEAESLVRTRFSDATEWPEVRAAAGRSLVGRVPNSELEPVLREMLRGSETRGRVGATEVLWLMKAPAEELLPVLQAALFHPLASVRSAALSVLQQMGPAALPAVDSIKPLLLDAKDGVRHEATNLWLALQRTNRLSAQP